MNQIEFIKYEKANDEKYLGIATVKLYGKILLRYKIVMNKDGSGFFPAAASYKNPAFPDQYYSSFMLDSNSEKEEVENCIRSNVKRYMQAETQQAQSAFQQQPAQQPNPNYQQPQQQQYVQPQQQAQYARAQPAPLPAQQSIFGDENVPF